MVDRESNFHNLGSGAASLPSQSHGDKNAATGRKRLPIGFKPKANDIICNRGGGGAYHHPGNTLLRRMVDAAKGKYANSTTKFQKSLIVSELVDAAMEKAETGFVRFDKDAAVWECVSERLAREKVGQLLRAAVKGGGGPTVVKVGDVSKFASAPEIRQRGTASSLFLPVVNRTVVAGKANKVENRDENKVKTPSSMHMKSHLMHRIELATPSSTDARQGTPGHDFDGRTKVYSERLEELSRGLPYKKHEIVTSDLACVGRHANNNTTVPQPAQPPLIESGPSGDGLKTALLRGESEGPSLEEVLQKMNDELRTNYAQARQPARPEFDIASPAGLHRFVSIGGMGPPSLNEIPSMASLPDSGVYEDNSNRDSRTEHEYAKNEETKYRDKQFQKSTL